MLLFFDLLIAILFVATAIPAVILLYHRKKDKKSWEYKHKKASLLISIILLIGTTILFYGSFIEPRLLIVNEQTINLPNIEKPIKIAFFADMQVGLAKETKHIEQVVYKILKFKPDIVLIGGDHINNENIEKNELVYLKPLERLAKQIPTFAINGNHEYGIGGGKAVSNPLYRAGNISLKTKQALEELGITYLVNEIELVTSTPSQFYLFGGDEYWAGKLDFKKLDERQNLNIPTIALIHNPASIWLASKHDIDLMLAGHTHGGQIRFPFIGPLGRIDNTLPAKLYQGLHEIEGMKLFVTSGTGETGTRARLFNPPEIVIMTIK